MSKLVERLMSAANLVANEDADLLIEAADEIGRLRGWLEGDANCPCCEASDVCRDGCTFAEDCPEDNDKMLEIRKLLTHNVGAVRQAPHAAKPQPDGDCP